MPSKRHKLPTSNSLKITRHRQLNINKWKMYHEKEVVFISIYYVKRIKKRKYIRNKAGQSHKGISWLREHKNLKCFLSNNSILKFEVKFKKEIVNNTIVFWA